MNSEMRLIILYLAANFTIFLGLLVISLAGYLGFLDPICKCINGSNDRFQILILISGMFTLVSGAELVGVVRNPQVRGAPYRKDQDPIGVHKKALLIASIIAILVTAATICPEISAKLGVGNVC